MCNIIRELDVENERLKEIIEYNNKISDKWKEKGDTAGLKDKIVELERKFEAYSKKGAVKKSSNKKFGKHHHQ